MHYALHIAGRLLWWLAAIGVTAVGLFLVAFVLLGCAAKKPLRPAAHLEIPRDCVLDTSFTKKTVCTALPGDGDHALCSNMLVHHGCVRATKNQ